VTLIDLCRLFDIEELPASFTAGAPRPLQLAARQPVADAQVDEEITHTIMAELRRRSALLIRGVNAVNAPAVAAFADRLFAGEEPFSTGEHPHADGADALYRPVRFAPDETLLWHHENSFNATWPRYILFACAVPATAGGATTIVDSRLVYAHMPLTIRQRLAEQGITYERLCDGRAGRTWEQIYGTTDKTEALQLAHTRGEQLVFTADGARIRARRPAFQAVAHGTSWFNQVLHWHPHALPQEIRTMVTHGLLPAYRTCYLGGGEQITPDVVDQLIAAHRQAEFAVQWQAGDVLVIDNAVIAHGRRPYRGRREHFVRMAGLGPADADQASTDARS